MARWRGSTLAVTVCWLAGSLHRSGLQGGAWQWEERGLSASCLRAGQQGLSASWVGSREGGSGWRGLSAGCLRTGWQGLYAAQVDSTVVAGREKQLVGVLGQSTGC